MARVICPCYLRLLFCPTRVLRGHLLCVCVLTDLDETPFIHTTLSILWLLSRRIKTKVCEVYTMTWAVGGKFLCCSCLLGPTVILNMQKMFSSRVFSTVKTLCSSVPSNQIYYIVFRDVHHFRSPDGNTCWMWKTFNISSKLLEFYPQGTTRHLSAPCDYPNHVDMQEL